MIDRMGNGHARGLVVLSTCGVASLLFFACGGSASHSDSASRTTSGPPTPATRPDVAPTAADFVNINSMTRVGDHFVGSLNGQLDAVLAVARNPAGGIYPVGTVIQLIPTEAMVKRHRGYSAATGDWEFFALKVSPQGTRIGIAGPRVKNFFGGDCSSCHRAAASRFDFVCEKNHGCAPLGITDALIASIQRGDPRPKR
jgi:hypothetical protein